MSGILRRLAFSAVGALVMVMLVMPVAAQASTSKADSTTLAHIARALAKAPAGVTHWSITVRTMTASGLTGSLGRDGAGLLTNTVYGNCGSAWMAIGNQGAGRAWISLGWDIKYSAYSESFATAVAPAGSKAGGGAIAPWSSHSWDTGYSAFEGYWVGVFGSAWMAAYLYPFQGPSSCVSNGPTAYSYITP